MYRKNATLGVILILIGIFAILNQVFNLDMFTIGKLWPLFILIPGLLFELGYFVHKGDAGLLVPGGILTTIGSLFLFETYTGWYFAAYTWPVYPLAVAVGLFQLYVFGGREKGLLVPVFILGSVSIISFATMVNNELKRWLNTGLILPAILIVIGLWILFKNYGKK